MLVVMCVTQQNVLQRTLTHAIDQPLSTPSIINCMPNKIPRRVKIVVTL